MEFELKIDPMYKRLYTNIGEVTDLHGLTLNMGLDHGWSEQIVFNVYNHLRISIEEGILSIQAVNPSASIPEVPDSRAVRER